jgi:hypothetical protein
MSDINFRTADLSRDAVKLVATFLRFEFALKEAGFCPRGGDAIVEWGRVTKKLGAVFYKAVRKSGNADTIVKRPPKKQIARDHQLEWERQAAPANVHQLFEAVRRVRNNLVHGGKSGGPDADPNDPGRKKRLIQETQWIVEQAIYALPDVRKYFEGRY